MVTSGCNRCALRSPGLGMARRGFGEALPDLVDINTGRNLVGTGAAASAQLGWLDSVGKALPWWGWLMVAGGVGALAFGMLQSGRRG